MYDYHTHSSFSDDCSTPMKDMIEAACSLGLKEIAITDHYDPDYPDTDYPFDLSFSSYHNALNETKEIYKKDIKVIKGIEIGIQLGDTLKKCYNEVLSFHYDFVLGSFHCAEGFELYKKGFFENRTINESYTAFYNYMLESLKVFDDYDVLGHFNIIDRYSSQIPEANHYMDIIESILKIIIAKGKGIEINTSSFRYGMGDRTTPSQEILQLYKDLGGEIITIGSDAHKTRDVGYKLDYAQQMIKTVGLRYLTTFDQRIPNFIKL